MNWLSKLLFTTQTTEQLAIWANSQMDEHNSKYSQELIKLEGQLPAFRNKATELIQNLSTTQLSSEKNILKEELLITFRNFLSQLESPGHERDFSQLHTKFKQLAEQLLPLIQTINTSQTTEIKKYFHELEQQFIAPYAYLKKRDNIIQIQNTLTQLNALKEERKIAEQHKLALIDKKEKLLLEQQSLISQKEEITLKEEFIEIKKQILSKAKDRENAELEIKNLFNTIKPVLLSHFQKTGNEICKSYAENPIETIIRDYSFGILKHYSGLYKETISEQIHQALAKLNKQDLGKMIHNYAGAKKKEADLHNSLANKEIMKQYEDILIKIKELKEQINETEEEITILKLPQTQEIQDQLQKQLEPHKIKLS